MGTDRTIETQLAHKLTMLPDDRLREVLDFVEYLLSKEQKAQTIIPPETLDRPKTPFCSIAAVWPMVLSLAILMQISMGSKG